MAPPTSFPNSSHAIAPPPRVPSLGNAAPPAVVQAAEEFEYQYRCRFCGQGFNNRYVFSAHYYVHKGLPDQVYIELGPKNSKVRRRILARLAGREFQPKKTKAGRPRKAKKARAQARSLSPEPIRAVFPTGISPQIPFPVLGHKPAGRARAFSPEHIRAFFPPGASPQASFPILGRRPAGKARALFPEPKGQAGSSRLAWRILQGASPQVPFPILGVRPKGQAGSSRVAPAAAPGPQAREPGQAVRVQGWGGVPILKDYASWMTHFRRTGPVDRVQEPRGLRMRKDNGAGPSSTAAGSQVVAMAPGEFDPPPGFGHVVPDLNFPIASNIRSVVKKEIIIID